jgi:hypothetical protein
VSAGPPTGLDPAEALNRLGSLIDLSHDLNKAEGLRTAISWSEGLFRRDLSEKHRALLHYLTGNAWSALDQFLHQGQDSTWSWQRPEVEHEVLDLRTAALLAGRASVPTQRRCQIHTNLGNALSKIGRFVEALDAWDDALAIDSHFAMAVGNRGFGLLHYARQLFDPGHVALFIQTCSAQLQRALESELEPGARQPMESALVQARTIAKHMGLPKESLIREHSLGESAEEVTYRRWCLRHRLFVSPLNDLAPHSIAAADVLHLPSMTLALNQPPSLLGYFNQLKQEYVSARYMYYEGITATKPHFSDRHVTQVNTLDYPAYCLAVERVKAAFRSAYSILDKLAFLINEYLDLGVPAHRTSLRSIWYQDQRCNRGLRVEFRARRNWPMRGLYWLSKDLAEDRPGFREAMSPDAQDLRVIRNHLEHKYLKLHEESWVGSHNSEDRAGGFSMDTLAKSLNRDDFERKTLRVLKLARAGLIYTSLAVHVEERSNAQNRDPEAVIPAMPMDVWEDDWKR